MDQNTPCPSNKKMFQNINAIHNGCCNSGIGACPKNKKGNNE